MSYESQIMITMYTKHPTFMAWNFNINAKENYNADKTQV